MCNERLPKTQTPSVLSKPQTRPSLGLVLLVILSTYATGAWAQPSKTTSTGRSKQRVAQPSLPLISYPSAQILLHYGQTPGPWGSIRAIEEAKGSLTKVEAILEENYGTYQAAFARAGGELHLSALGTRSRLKGRIELEGAALGEVSNPVVPELHAHQLIAPLIGIGAEYQSEPQTSYRWSASVMPFFARGKEKRIDAVSTDLIEKMPTHNGYAQTLGAEGATSLSSNLDLGAGVKPMLETAAMVRYSYVTSSAKPNPLSTLGTQTHWIRWRLSEEASQNLSTGITGSGHLVAGINPTYKSFLPVSYDYISQIPLTAELGTMVGYGGKISHSFGASDLQSAHFGFYGGYIGGGADFEYKSAKLALMTYGLELSSAYQIQGQRFYMAQFGLAL